MRFEELHGVRIPKVGFGTWNIGGGMSADRRRDAESLAALRSALELGYTHFDTAESYADGHCEELLGAAIRDVGVARDALFLTSKVKPHNLTADGVISACDGSLRRIGCEYLDLYLVHWPSATIPLEETFAGLNKLVGAGRVKNLGVSNFDAPLLDRARRLSATPIITNQIPYSFHDRSFVRNGVLDYCQSNDILVTAYSPLKGAGLRPAAELKAIARKRQVTLFSAAIAWLCSQPRVVTIPMSTNPAHQRANLEAADVVLSADDLTADPARTARVGY